MDNWLVVVLLILIVIAIVVVSEFGMGDEESYWAPDDEQLPTHSRHPSTTSGRDR
jgi:hypothetical protein